MSKSNKTKSERFVDISFLLFFERDMGPLQSLTVPLSFLVGKNGIYGDSGKRDAFQAAIELSELNNKRSAILDMRVPVDNVVGDSGRIGLNDIDSLSFINIAALAILKREAIDRLDFLVSEAGRAKYPRLEDVDVRGWLDRDPSLVSSVFDAYPNLLFAVLGHPCDSLQDKRAGRRQFPVVFFRSAEKVQEILKRKEVGGKLILSVRYQSCPVVVDEAA